MAPSRSRPLLNAGLALALVLFTDAGVCLAKGPQVWKGHRGPVTAVSFSPDGRTVASAGIDGEILLRRLDGTEVKPSFAGHKNGVFALAFAPDGKTLASAGADEVVRVWAIGTGRELFQLRRHRDSVAAVAFAPDGKVLASGGYDGVIRLWDPATGKEVRELRGHDGRVTALAFSRDGKRLVSGGIVQSKLTDALKNVFWIGQADFVRLWDLTGKAEARRLASRGSSVAFSANGKTIAAGGLVAGLRQRGRGTTLDGFDVISLADASTGKVVHEIKWRGQAVAFSPDGKFLASSAGAWVHLAALAMVGSNVVITSNTDERLRLWEAATAREVLRLPQTDATALAFSPDGKTLAAGGAGGSVTLWDLEAERRDPTPDPAEVIEPPPAGDKLLVGLDADFQELLKKERNPEPLREANRLFNHTNQSDRWTDYLDALALVRRHRSKAGIPLVLRYLVQHASLSGFHSRDYVDTLVILTGEDVADSYRYIEAPVKAVREDVQALVDRWWRPDKDSITTDLGRMSGSQLQVVADRLLKCARRSDYMLPPGSADRASCLLASVLQPDEDTWPGWVDEDLHPALVPFLLAPAGYEDPPAGQPGAWENHPFPYAAVPLLAALRKNGKAPSLDRIARDKTQNSAVRLACLLALYAAGEELRSESLLGLLGTEKKLERRFVAILALGYCQDAAAANAQLLKLLDDRNVYVRGAALGALHGTRPREALPRLKRLLEKGDPREAIGDVVSLVGKMGTQESREILATFLARTLEGGPNAGYLIYTLKIFGDATGRDWTPAMHSESDYRRAAAKALEWWKGQRHEDPKGPGSERKGVR